MGDSKLIQFRASEEQRRALRVMAAQTGRTMQDILSEALDALLAAHQDQAEAVA